MRVSGRYRWCMTDDPTDRRWLAALARADHAIDRLRHHVRPRVPTYINAYMTGETMQRAVADLLLGNGAWNMRTPVDPFAGDEQARY